MIHRGECMEVEVRSARLAWTKGHNSSAWPKVVTGEHCGVTRGEREGKP